MSVSNRSRSRERNLNVVLPEEACRNLVRFEKAALGKMVGQKVLYVGCYGTSFSSSCFLQCSFETRVYPQA